MFPVGDLNSIALSRGPGWGLVSVHLSGQALTCRDEKDAGAEDDAVSAMVELAGRHAEPAEEEQRHAEDGEDAGGPHSPCGEGKRAVPAPQPSRVCPPSTGMLVGDQHWA